VTACGDCGRDRNTSEVERRQVFEPLRAGQTRMPSVKSIAMPEANHKTNSGDNAIPMERCARMIHFRHEAR
jgi:hypothetical protein